MRKTDPPEALRSAAPLTPGRLLRWLYLGRLTLVCGILAAALLVWGEAQPEQTFLVTVMFALALAVSGAGIWYGQVHEGEPSRNFLYGQVIFDVLLVTGVVHLTGGGASDLAWLYILVISEGALLLPLPGGVLIGGFASILYFADIVWGHSETLSGSVALQIGLFALVALMTGVLGDRLRRAGIALGAAQSELRRLRMDTGDILETISTGVVTVQDTGRLIYMNPAAEALLGIRVGEWRGALVWDAIGRVAPELLEILQRSLEGGLTLRRQKATAVRGAEPMTLGVSTTLREEEGVPTAVTAIFQDITDLERLALLNRQNERLGAVAELSAAMAHEIKNPLASIRSAVEQFSKPALEPSDRETLTRMIVRESDRLSRLLSDFIDFSRVKIGTLATVSVDEVIGDAVTLVRRHPDAEQRQITVEVEPEHTGLALAGDGDLLHRAFFNLILNAVQFSPEGGAVQVQVDDLRESRLARSVDVPAPVLIRIRDSGPGVPEEELSRIFDPFFTTRRGGSGLGLSVVHRAVEAHNGIVFVDRWSGGAEFNVYLPCKHATAGITAHG